MRIGMILDRDFPPDPRVENEAITLIKNGFEVYLFSLNFFNKKDYEIINDIHVFRYNMTRTFFIKFSPLAYSFPVYHLALKSKINHFIDNISPDVIHIHDMDVAGAVFLLNKKLNLPIVLDLHENRPEIMKTYSHINSGIGRFLVDINKWKNKESEFIKKSSRIIVVTNEAKQDIILEHKTASKNICVVPNTINLKTFNISEVDKNTFKKYKNDFVILYLGSTGIRRGLDTAIKAIKICKNTIDNIKLVLVGNSRDDIKLKKIAKYLNIEKDVIFEGWKDLSFFPSYIKASHVCISPLTRNRHHDTTYANKIFQYMCCGKPLIVSDCTAQKNVVQETNCGLIHKAGDEKELAEKILQFYKNPELRQKMGANGKKAVMEKYNWEKTSKNLIDLYSSFK